MAIERTVRRLRPEGLPGIRSGDRESHSASAGIRRGTHQVCGDFPFVWCALEFLFQLSDRTVDRARGSCVRSWAASPPRVTRLISPRGCVAQHTS